ncbi:MAG: phosphomannomutase/phosphoglucomutase, partial [Lysobacteraceae bacterium]
MAVFGIGGKDKDRDHDEGGASAFRLDPAQAARTLPLLALLLALLGVWCLASGALRIRDDSRHAGLEVARDDAARAVRRVLTEERQRLAERLASPAMKAALAADDTATAKRLLREGWTGLQRADVWPADLEPLYAGLPRTGFGTLATAEESLVSGKAAIRVIGSGAVQRLALASPVAAAGGPRLAYVELQATRLINSVKSPAVPGRTYLALRQGSQNVLERGDMSLNDAAEALAAKIPDSDLRVAASAPDPAATPFGLGGMAAVGLGSILLLAGAWLWFIVRPRMLGLRVEPGAAEAPTLGDMALEQPVPVIAREPALADAATAEASAKAAPAKSVPVIIDHRIFRAYDIRGVVGMSLDAGVAELIGQSIGSLMADKGLEDIVVGRDGRLSGPDLSAGLIAGLRKAGRNVIDIGVAPTPVVYFGCYHLRTGCGVSI